MGIFTMKKAKAKHEKESKAIEKASFICNDFLERKVIVRGELKKHLKELEDILQSLGKTSLLEVSEKSPRTEIRENMKDIAFCLM